EIRTPDLVVRSHALVFAFYSAKIGSFEISCAIEFLLSTVFTLFSKSIN
ncbi:uncharacterized protein METZ01_LOCUS235435, partial [marine metagenome]